jgi:hypothetical protein
LSTSAKRVLQHNRPDSGQIPQHSESRDGPKAEITPSYFHTAFAHQVLACMHVLGKLERLWIRGARRAPDASLHDADELG